MQTKEELEKLTVQQLKEKLKSRKLTTTGAKSELVNRLYESLVAEEKLLEAAGISEVDLSTVNVDEVLGLDTDTSILDKKSIDSPTKAEPKLDVRVPKQSIASTQGDATSNEVSTNKNDENSQSDTSSKTGDTSKIMLKNAVKLGLPISEDRIVKRAERFGPVASDSDDKIVKRAARFGITATKNEPQTEDKDKILKRAQRFGIPVKAGTASEQAGIESSSEVLTKRAKRFGLPSSEDIEEKKKARIEKFGIVAP